MNFEEMCNADEDSLFDYLDTMDYLKEFIPLFYRVRSRSAPVPPDLKMTTDRKVAGKLYNRLMRWQMDSKGYNGQSGKGRVGGGGGAASSQRQEMVEEVKEKLSGSGLFRL